MGFTKAKAEMFIHRQRCSEYRVLRTTSTRSAAARQSDSDTIALRPPPGPTLAFLRWRPPAYPNSDLDEPGFAQNVTGAWKRHCPESTTVPSNARPPAGCNIFFYRSTRVSL